MLSKRVIALSADKAFAKRLAAGLMGAGGAVETYASLEEIPAGEIKAEVVAIHVTDEHSTWPAAVAARLPASAHIIAVIPSSSIERTVMAMKAGKVAGVLVADDFSPATLAELTTRLLHGDIFGLEKIVPWGVRVYSILVGDYQEKSIAIAQISEFAAEMGIRRKYRESIEQCLDEMLMNALYDAPVDEHGKHLYSEVPMESRISDRKSVV